MRLIAHLDLQVGTVQREFIMGLLASSSFSKHLSAVRETNNLLMRALNVRQLDDGESIKVHTPTYISNHSGSAVCLLN